MNIRRLLCFIIVIAMVLSIVGCSSPSKAPDETAVPASVQMKPGTYTETVKGLNDMTVEVVLSETKIESIKIVNHNETEDISDNALTQIPEKILAEQNVEVDVVSGATLSSTAIITAVKQAIEKAGGDMTKFMAKQDETQSEPEPYPGYPVIEEIYNDMAQRAIDYAPKIATLPNGIKVQRTPDEYFAGVYHNPGESISYNTYYLDADNRGCNSCHESLGKQLNDMTYLHVNLENPYGMDTTVQQCIDCHSYSPGYLTEKYAFGTLMHGIHKSDAFEGDCMTCHNATGDGEGMQLWDLVKHDVLRGIVPIANVSGDFSYVQDKTVTQEETFNFNWMYYDEDYKRNAADLADIPLDPKVFNEWKIKVTGHVENEFEISLPDLIAEAPSETTTMLMHCTINPMGGPLLSNCEITGVPVSYLLEKAGVKEGATVLNPIANDGFSIPTSMEHLLNHNAYIVYEIDGKPLAQVLGYPVQIWIGGAAASSFVKQVVELNIVDDPIEDYYFYRGWERENGGYYNKPNIAICQVAEGQIIESGKPFTFEGFADGLEQNVVAVEFSMDRGETWTSYSTEGADIERWIYWNFVFTPPEKGAYVLMARAVTDEGLVSNEPVEVMVVAK
ncbi:MULTISPECIES: molybdopterin-dependent oxidoreductase [unclassified Sedimentibacter]|uniref:molybdopterin-dependent oxidoreductase n=1 Tax=unclassified Sedimentibacter TaxID=2649220 RepID=UPI0027DEC14A|nr:molybdopterin-dependent oxidoreductase [Sedimentibacter sp. MB35-C1]WMJ77097.1 molybdopterin-dependent oxidoreductase [Sedimentibacter sp. MB35-C1]